MSDEEIRTALIDIPVDDERRELFMVPGTPGVLAIANQYRNVAALNQYDATRMIAITSMTPLNVREEIFRDLQSRGAAHLISPVTS